MGLIIGWITNIILIVLFAAVLELLLPEKSVHRYVKLVVGLLLLVIMLQPLLTVFQHDTDDILNQMERWGQSVEIDDEENLDKLQNSDIETASLAYISEQVAVQLKREADPVLQNDYKMNISNIDVTFQSLHETADKDHLSGIYLTVMPTDSKQNDEDYDDDKVEVDRIDINSSSSDSKPEDKKGGSGMKEHLSRIWQVPEELIKLEVGGGEYE